MKAGADVESRSSTGLTPLHWACRFNDAASVETLLSAGADPCTVDQVARDMVATSPSSSGTIVSMPIAIDVVGLGYPFDRAVDSATLAARRLDLVTEGRIESALHDAKQERSWGRCGCLVIVANRLAETGAQIYSRMMGGRFAEAVVALLKRVVTNVKTGGASTVITRPPCAHQMGAGTDGVNAGANEFCHEHSASRDPPEELSRRHNAVDERPRSVGSVVEVAGEMNRQTRSNTWRNWSVGE